ncbi:MAG: hypothetical protein EKK42_20425 [Pseudonocardiaceae bacterium]|nr:MAG: hypothetical protein EKK42_20425 [Pseudonocardiaceae bacterium]
MTPPADILAIGEARQRELDALQRVSLEALGTTFPYLGEDPRPYATALSDVAPTLLASQQAGVYGSDEFVGDVLDAQGSPETSDFKLRPSGWADLTDGGGSWVKNLLYAPPAAWSKAVQQGLGTAIAAARARYVAQVITLDGLRDTARAADTTAMFGRKVTKYVRVLRGRSCARCAILAGRVYFIEAFRRHPNCDCYHIPLAETGNRARKWRTDPAAYFESLSKQDQNRIFGEGAAEAIRASDSKELAMSQVVNANKGVYTVNAFGREVEATREGMTRRGVYGGYIVNPDGSFTKRPVGDTIRDKNISPYRFARQPRLMPDEILALSKEFGWSREETIAQFRRFAYVF